MSELDIKCNNCGDERKGDSIGYCPACGSTEQAFINLPEAKSDDATIAKLNEALAGATKANGELEQNLIAVRSELGEVKAALVKVDKDNAALKRELDAAKKVGDKK